MSQPTPGEVAFARRFGLDPNAVARARGALDAIAALPWPESRRADLLAELAHRAAADVGPILGALALRRAPLASFEQLIDVPGLADKRVLGLARALADVNVAELVPDAVRLADTLAALARAKSENAALRAEIDRLHARLAGASDAPSSQVLRLSDLAASIGGQIAAADSALLTRARGLRLGDVELRLSGTASTLDGDVALDVASPRGGSALGLRYSRGGASGAAVARAGASNAGRANAGASGAGARTSEPSLAVGSSELSGEVPDVRGYTLAFARKKLAARGFLVALATAGNARAEGVVREQAPPAGTLARRSAPVQLVLR